MKGNEKISFTAEAIALFRANEKTDKFSKYFVTDKIKRKYALLAKIFPKSYFINISKRRNHLSRDIDKLIKNYAPEQIIELACGYSPRGLIFTQKNAKLIYIETDFQSVIDKKREILKEIEEKERIKLSKNHHLAYLDVLAGNIYDKLNGLIDKNKKTLIVAETLVSYLDSKEHDFLVENIKSLLERIKEGAYLSHEGNKMLPGLLGKLLIFYRNKISKTKSHKHFHNPEEITSYFKRKGFSSVKIVESKPCYNTLYLVEK